MKRWVIMEAPRLTASIACDVVAVLDRRQTKMSFCSVDNFSGGKTMTHECPMLTTKPASFNRRILPMTPCNSGATVINLTISLPACADLPRAAVLTGVKFSPPYMSKNASHPS